MHAPCSKSVSWCILATCSESIVWRAVVGRTLVRFLLYDGNRASPVVPHQKSASLDHVDPVIDQRPDSQSLSIRSLGDYEPRFGPELLFELIGLGTL